MPEVAPLDPERIVRVLAAHGVDYVLIDALAARLQGFPRLTADIDITPAPDPENLRRLAAATAGRLDLAFRPSGTEGFRDLASGAVRFEVFGVELLAASLRDIIRSKEAADRLQDRQDVLVLREILRRESN